jgi:purine-binding chemotaxis protein CheW
MMEALARGLTNTSEGINLVTVRLDQQHYALPVDSIVQIVAMVTITPLPHTLESVMGVINVRGAAAPVIDLRCHMGMSASTLGLYTPIILAKISGRLVGLVVDEVIDVLRVNAEDIVALDNIFPEGITELPLLHGMARTGNSMVPVLALERLFHPEMLKSLTRSINLFSPIVPAVMPQDNEPVLAEMVNAPQVVGAKSGNGRKTERRGKNGSGAQMSPGADQ